MGVRCNRTEVREGQGPGLVLCDVKEESQMGDHIHSTESLYPMEASYNLEPLYLTQSFFAEIYTSYI